MKSFAEELQIRERGTLGPVAEQTLRLGVKEKSDVGFGFRHGQIRVSPTSSTLFSNEEGPLPNMWCTFCNGPQPSIRCAVVTDPQTWKNIVRQRGRCFGCLKTSHIIFFYVEMQRRTKINNEYANTKLEAEKDGKKIVRLRIRLHCRLAHSFFSGKNLFPYLMEDHVW